MRIDILSCVPQLMESPLAHSILLRAKEKGLLEVFLHNIRDFTINKYKTVDDYPYGTSSGMVLKPEPIAKAIHFLQEQRDYQEIIYLCPDGEVLNQSIVNELSLKKNIILLAGHYKGVDQRIRDKYITREISIGDYVLSGGELPALVLTDAIGRVIPGVLGDETSALSDSFQFGLLDAPAYTRPRVFENMEVPEILTSGNHAKIEEWLLNQMIEKTKKRRPDLFEAWEKDSD